MSAGPRWLVHEPQEFDAALALATLWLSAEGSVTSGSIHCLDEPGESPTARDPALHQFVTRGGRLEHNAWLWLERAGGTIADQTCLMAPADIDDLPANAVVLVATSVEAKAPPRQGIDVIDLVGDGDGDGDGDDQWFLVQRSSGDVLLRACRDVFGRIVARPWAAMVRTSEDGASGLRVAIAGESEHLRQRYPGVLAALGDAVDALGIAVEVDIRSPRALSAADAATLVGDVDALILPGGCDNSQVAGMIALAGAALDANLPTLGLCFGMQAMATAAIRTRLGMMDVALEEVDPEASEFAVVGMPGESGGLRHRLGEHRSRIITGSRLAAIHATPTLDERMNHRYRLADCWEAPLADVGIIVSARSTDAREIADVIEATDRRFYLGYQGHPELLSAPERPHPAFTALLSEALDGVVTKF
ncbi:glutamine amidotransferase-related protein [Kushneria aurantia]|uniref:CTP synthase (glutamine hydrolyzing) n=1 Tax=Kushneria aurantia TaxID=504092 RepID=A0ABV6G1L9_9GAMM|nr:gamma-glutamyl-gamma-aminobutyrate hydrolase family protein [Kushneria aurantia]